MNDALAGLTAAQRDLVRVTVTTNPRGGLDFTVDTRDATAA